MSFFISEGLLAPVNKHLSPSRIVEIVAWGGEELFILLWIRHWYAFLPVDTAEATQARVILIMKLSIFSRIYANEGRFTSDNVFYFHAFTAPCQFFLFGGHHLLGSALYSPQALKRSFVFVYEYLSSRIPDLPLRLYWYSDLSFSILWSVERR